MKTIEWKWKTKDGLEIFSKAWEPTKEAKGIVCLLHGVGEHIGRYQADGEALANEDYIMAGFDQRGFGKSEGKRGHTPSLEMYFNDIDLFFVEIARQYPKQPVFLYGHSMGAILGLAYLSVRLPAVSGIIATSPGLKSSIEEQKIKVLIVKILGNVLPSFTLNTGIIAQQLSRDPMIAEEYINDPLVHPFGTTAWGKTMLEAIELVWNNAPHFPLPVLLMHGTKDEIAYSSSSQIFAELAPKDKVTLIMWEDFMHELHTDPEKEKIFKTMINWLNKQMIPDQSIRTSKFFCRVQR